MAILTSKHPDDGHQGLVTSLDQIVPGVKLYRVYGHLSPMWIEELLISHEPVDYNTYRAFKGDKPSDSTTMGEWFACYKDGLDREDWHSTHDCGIGARYNVNRLCLSRESAEAYYAKCGKQRAAHEADRNYGFWL